MASCTKSDQSPHKKKFFGDHLVTSINIISLGLDRFRERAVTSLLCTAAQRWGIVRSAKRCHRCILGLMYSASSKLESQNLAQCSVCSVHCMYSHQLLLSRSCISYSGTLASNRQNTANPEYNDDISLLISQYLISATANNPELREEEALELPNQISHSSKPLSSQLLILSWPDARRIFLQNQNPNPNNYSEYKSFPALWANSAKCLLTLVFLLFSPSHFKIPSAAKTSNTKKGMVGRVQI